MCVLAKCKVPVEKDRRSETDQSKGEKRRKVRKVESLRRVLCINNPDRSFILAKITHKPSSLPISHSQSFTKMSYIRKL
jgi:hypothetical protein